MRWETHQDSVWPCQLVGREGEHCLHELTSDSSSDGGVVEQALDVRGRERSIGSSLSESDRGIGSKCDDRGEGDHLGWFGWVEGGWLEWDWED